MPRFTEDFIKALKLEDGRRDKLVFDTATAGLGVRVTPKSKTFIGQWTDPATGRKVRDSIGPWGEGGLTLKQARDAMSVRRGAIAKGFDPKAEKQRQKQEAERERLERLLTVESLIDEWRVIHLAQRRPGYAAEAPRAIRAGLSDLLTQPAARVSRAAAVNALDRIVKAGKAATAGRTLAYARACFEWGKRRGKVAENPFSGLPFDIVTRQRERVLEDAEIAEVWAAASTLHYPWNHFFKLALLTLQRRAEVAGMRWSEIGDFDNRLWRIAGSRMKNNKPHDVHLSAPAIAILRDIPKVAGCDFVFTTDGKNCIAGFSTIKVMLDAALAKARGENLPAWVLHDFRRTGVTALARMGFDSIVVDKLLAHQPAKLSGVAAIYQRHDFARERAAALDAWAAHVTGEHVENVVSLQKRA